MRILFVCSYPPARCGIGRYGHQFVTGLRSEGHEVDVMSIDGTGDVRYPYRLSSPRDGLKALLVSSRYDRIMVNYSLALVPAGGGPLRARWAQYFFHLFLYLLFLWRGSRVELLMHDFVVPVTTRQQRLFELFWARAPKLSFHSEDERRRLLGLFPSLPESRTRVISPHGHYVPSYFGNQGQARQELGLPEDQVVFLACGFLHPAKGFDRAARVFLETPGLDPRAHLHIVGSPMPDKPEHEGYLAELRGLAAASERIHLAERFLDDRTFDAWIVASDYVLVPYRPEFGWSSSIIGRARLFGRQVIATRVGALEHQSVEHLVEDDSGLAAAIQGLSGTRPAYEL